MKNILFCLIIILLVGCETFPLVVNNGPNSQTYDLTAVDFVADSSDGSQVMTPIALGATTSFKQGKVICYEFTDATGYTGCCCDNPFNLKVLDRTHTCGH